MPRSLFESALDFPNTTNAASSLWHARLASRKRRTQGLSGRGEHGPRRDQPRRERQASTRRFSAVSRMHNGTARPALTSPQHELANGQPARRGNCSRDAGYTTFPRLSEAHSARIDDRCKGRSPRGCSPLTAHAAFLRQPMKPSPEKPANIIAQVEGSGTAPPKTKSPDPSVTIVRSMLGPKFDPKLKTASLMELAARIWKRSLYCFR